MTVGTTFHGTDPGPSHGQQVQEDPSSSSDFHHYNMSLTYSDFLYALPPAAEALEDVPPAPPPSTLSRQQSPAPIRRHGGSTTSIFGSLTGQSSSNLPYEFQVLQESTVPLLQNAEEKDGDFIIIAEFSELEGPIPLCTIPHDAPVTRTDINLNSLSIHLMSTDYQVNSVGNFKVCEDTQVMRTNVFPKVHVFMQYFTLYDIKARGFVRPFCFGYVSKDHVKLEQIVQALAKEFTQISKVLKYANRVWFGDELNSYLLKLSSAKDNFTSRTLPPEEGEGEDGHFYFDTGEVGADPISLSQIAYQFTEIENILSIVNSVEVDPECISVLNTHESIMEANSTNHLGEMLNKLNFIGDTFCTLQMPLVHPLKQKGESLRPITILGQVGTFYLVHELLKSYEQHREDVIFTEMSTLTQDFRTHSEMIRKYSGIIPNFQSTLTEEPAKENSEVVNEDFLCIIIEKLHASVPLLGTENRSCSYHSLSDESDVQFPAGVEETNSIVENGGSSDTSATAFGSIEYHLNRSGPTSSQPVSKTLPIHANESKLISESPTKSPRKKELSATSLTSPSSLGSETKQPLSARASASSTGSGSWFFAHRLSIGYESEEDSAGREAAPHVTEPCAEVEIAKIPWWAIAARTNIVKEDPGYGIWKFFRRFHKLGHHILFSILIGRPIIFCARAKFRERIRYLILALTPFISCFPAKSFKILPWLQGTLSPLNFRHCYKLVGLCIPERMSVHDLVHPKEQNFVTVLDFEAKTILGPAYNGNILKNFEELVCQKKFFDDLSVLTYLGSIFAELESHVFMFKTMHSDGEQDVVKIMKHLNLKNSDADIIKYLASTIKASDEAVNLF